MWSGYKEIKDRIGIIYLGGHLQPAPFFLPPSFSQNGKKKKKKVRHPLFAFVACSSCTKNMLSAFQRSDLTAWMLSEMHSVTYTFKNKGSLLTFMVP